MSSRFYLAGPMTGIPSFNFPAFKEAARVLRDRGLEVISPAEIDDPETHDAAMASPDGAMRSASPHGQTWGDFLSRDIKLVADVCTAVVLLPGWEKSRGARLEAYVALLCDHLLYAYSPTSGYLTALPRSSVMMDIYANT